MEKQKLIQMMWTLMLTGVLYAGSAVAVPQWYTCDIDTIGAKDRTDAGKPSKVVVTLDDTAGSPAFTDQEFKFPDRSRKEMMATVLTAITNGFQVDVFTDVDVGKQPLIIEIHLVKSP